MTNLQVAQAFVENALAYGLNDNLDLDFRLKVVMANLQYIDKCLQQPDRKNEDHDEEDFK
jgi:hypothetical protein